MPAKYYITICAKDRKHRFGTVVGVDLCVDPQIKNAFVSLSPIGEIADYYLKSIPNKFPNVRLDEYVVMPNHTHFIIEIIDPGVDPSKGSTQRSTPTANIPGIIQWFKTVVHNEFFRIESETNHGHIGKLWQRNYYEHIIRGKGDYERIREYILNNPDEWERNKNITNPHLIR